MKRVVYAMFSLGMSLVLFSNDATSQPIKGEDNRLRFELRLAEKKPADGLQEMVVPQTKDKIYVHPHAILSNADVAKARVGKTQREEPAVIIAFKETSRKKVIEFSENNMGKIAAILIDGKLVSAPTSHGRFSREAEVSGGLTQEEAERIVKSINAK